MDILYKKLKRNEIKKLRAVNREEIIEKLYYYQKGKLVLKDEYYDVKSWNLEEIQGLIGRLDELHIRGGTIYGAFDGDRIVGMAALDSKLIGRNKDQLKLDILYVSKGYRKMGIGNRLMAMVKEQGKEKGVSKLYISATPSENTVNFYMNLGCQLAVELNKTLYQMEPEDIHLEWVL